MAVSAVDGSTVLYVDADPATTADVSDAMAAAGATVRPAADLEAAVSALDACDPDYVVTTHDLPHADALDVIEAVTARADLPVVVFTDADDPGLTEAVFDAGAHFVPDHGGDAGQLRRHLEGLAAGSVRAALPESVKEQAMDEAPVGITIADASAPDELLVYANDAFEELTGYATETALGRNCRFLQSGCTRPEASDQIRDAIDAEKPVSVELRNRRRDGELFWNRVDVAPVRDDSGTVTHYVGFQTDVTRRRQAEDAARRWAAECRDERRAVEHVLDRIKGLIAQITRALVESRSRRELERRVCDCIATTDGYAGTWIGEVDSPRQVVDARARAGDLPTELLREELSLAEGGVPADALATGEVRVEPDATALDAVEHASAAEMSVAVVPITYREIEYGLLLVYSTDSEAFEDHDTVVLGSIGREVGAAINALENKRMRTADGVVDVEVAVRGHGPLTAVAEATDTRLVHEGLNRREDGTLLSFLRADGAVSSSALDRALERSAARSGTVVHEGPDRSLLEVLLPADCPLAQITDLGVRLTDAEIDPERALLGIEAPGEPLARTAVDVLEDSYGDLDLRALHRRSRPGRSQQTFVRSVRDSLTDRQLTALETAYRAGFFEWPHETTGEELAATMGVSRSTFHQHLHAAQRKIFEAVFDPES